MRIYKKSQKKTLGSVMYWDTNYGKTWTTFSVRNIRDMGI